MRNLLKMNSKCHFENDIKLIPRKLINDTKHMHPKLEELFLMKQGIPIIKHQFSICKTCYACLKNNKI